MPSESWQSEFDRLWDELVPSSGQAATVQGELVRASGRLSDEAYRNGNINFDKGHRILCKYLRDHLKDPSVFSVQEMGEIDQWIDQILDAKHPDIRGGESCHYRLAEMVVRWCNSKTELIPHQLNPALKR